MSPFGTPPAFLSLNDDNVGRLRVESQAVVTRNVLRIRVPVHTILQFNNFNLNLVLFILLIVPI